MYAQAGRNAALGFIMLADDPLPSPVPRDVTNGHFEITDPAAPGFGWQVNGAATFAAGQGVIHENAALFSDLSQTFTLPAG
jgi:hypothetical protein